MSREDPIPRFLFPVDDLETGSGNRGRKVDKRAAKDEKLAAQLAQLPTTIAGLSHHYPGLALRDYQIEPAVTIARSISEGRGGQFALAFSRQSGKDELLAQLLAWLLIAYAAQGGSAVIAAPSKSPQADMSRDRLVARLMEVMPEFVQVKQGYIVEVGKASARFLSASPVANVRGQTADLLLVGNEAQGIDPDVWDPVFDPMAASTNATTLFMGTVWTRETLLARQMRYLESLQAREGRTRVWKVRWERVAALVPAYGDRVAAALAQFGEDHPFIRTEYCLEELDGEQGFFPPHRLAAMRGDHPRRHGAESGGRYLLLLDVAGEEEHGGTAEAFASTGRRDSTALTVVEIDERHGRRPIFRVVDRRSWTGIKHPALRDELVHLARQVWRAERVVIDATGIGAGLASFLEAELTDRRLGRPITVQRFIFSSASKSQLGWDLIGLIDTGRYREYRDEAPVGSPERRVTEQFWAELRGITYEVQPGPHKLMRWGALHGKGHDDLVMSAALIAAVDPESVRRRVAVGTLDICRETNVSGFPFPATDLETGNHRRKTRGGCNGDGRGGHRDGRDRGVAGGVARGAPGCRRGADRGGDDRGAAGLVGAGAGGVWAVAGAAGEVSTGAAGAGGWSEREGRSGRANGGRVDQAGAGGGAAEVVRRE